MVFLGGQEYIAPRTHDPAARAGAAAADADADGAGPVDGLTDSDVGSSAGPRGANWCTSLELERPLPTINEQTLKMAVPATATAHLTRPGMP